MYKLTTNRGNRYETDDDGSVIARSNGPEGWNYSGQWIILGLAKRHHSFHTISLAAAAAGADFGHGIVRDLDHGTFRQWGGERVVRIDKVQ